MRAGHCVVWGFKLKIGLHVHQPSQHTIHGKILAQEKIGEFGKS